MRAHEALVRCEGCFCVNFQSEIFTKSDGVNAHLGVFLVRCKTRKGVLWLPLPLLTT